MAERLRETAELDPAPIAGALEDWLQAEIESSMRGKNAYLDDWKQWQEDSKLAFEDGKNQDAGKARSHFDRLQNWTLDTEQNWDFWHDEYWLARQMFCAQMFISGAYRKQCFIEAADQEDYLRRRKEQGPAGINILDLVDRRLKEYYSGNAFPEYPHTTFPQPKLLEKTLRINNVSLEVSKDAHNMHIDNSETNDRHVLKLLQIVQNHWAKLFVDYMFYTAQMQAIFKEEIALLEPKSMSENPKMYYPFKEIGR
jgi:hypothetical protein